MTYCGEQGAVKYAQDCITCVSLKCRSWQCDECKEMRSRQLMAQCMKGSPTTFLTLTWRVRPNVTRNEAAKRLSHAWRLLRLRIMRRHGWAKLPFLAVFEQTKNGWPHLHIIMRSGYIRQQWIAATMNKLIGSPVCWIEKIDNVKKIVAYVAKYCSKDAHKFGTSKRYWQSQDWQLESDEEGEYFKKGQGGWDRYPEGLLVFIASYKSIGYEVYQPSYDKAHAFKRLETG